MKHLLIIPVMAFLIGEYTTGNTKQCIYENYNGQYTITIQSYKLCPLNIDV